MINKYFDLPGNQYVQAVALVDTTGAAYSAGIATASTGTQTSVASSVSDTTILASNSSRKGCTLYNDSTAILYVLLASGASSLSTYNLQLPPNGMLSLRVGEYLGVIKGVWDSANGFVRVTEFV